MNVQSRILGLISLVLFLAFLPSCEKNKSENPEDLVCNETINSVSYYDDIQPIIASNCYRCHSNENNGELAEGNDLEDYLDIFPFAKAGTLSGVVRHDDGFIPMPLNDDKLTLCDILKIELWVAEGAMEN